MKCIYKDCSNTDIIARCLCEKHYHKIKYLGKLNEYPRMKRKDGTGTFQNGYKKITTNGKRIFEHRKVIENFIGRKLKKSEKIHHIDGDKLNNKVSNLIITSQKDHIKTFHNNQPRIFNWNKFTPQNKDNKCQVCNKKLNKQNRFGLCRKHYNTYWCWKQRH